MADKVRQVPAQKVLRAALALLNQTHEATTCAGSGNKPGKVAPASQEEHCASPQSKSHQRKDRFANRVARMDANLAVRALRHCWG
jgi:hypothetical protein